jgi:subtilisin family serine protease
MTMCVFSSTTYSVTKLDPALDMVASPTSKAMSAAVSKSLNLRKSTSGDRVVDCLVRARDVSAVRDFINANGGTTRSIVGEIMTAWVPVDILSDLNAMPEVIYVEAAKRLAPKLGDSNSTYSNGDGTATNPGNARVVTQANLVQAGTGSGLGGTSYNGSGVIVGVVDSGIQCDNADFITSGTSRIIAYWDQSFSFSATCTGGTGVQGVPQEVAGTGGCEYTAEAIQAGTCTESPDSDTSEGHGTHVTGIAAGSNSTYTGMAPGASIIAVLQSSSDASSGGTFSSSVIDAVNYIFRRAQQTNKPAVANISLGTSLGAHDDTSNFEQGLNALLSGVQGRAIVNAQGNENLPTSDSSFATLGGIHALISASSSTVAYEYLLRSNTASSAAYSAGGAVADIWLAAGGTCTVALNAFSGTQKTSATVAVSGVSAGNQSSGTDGTITVTINFTDNANANNGKQHAQVVVTGASSSKSTSLDNYTYDLIFSGTCSGHAWLYPDQTAYIDFTKNLNATTNATYGYTYVAGDSNYTTTIPATASSVIAAGSFMGRTFWTNILGASVNNTSTSSTCSTGYGGTVSDISLFSSLGPTADGRTKPDITAPGEPIVSTLASTASVATACKADSTHHVLWGTSMSSPAVAGIVALILQRNGCLTPAQIKSALTTYASTDSSTGTIASTGSNTWGFGKVNALSSVVNTTAQTCSPDNTSEDGAGTTAGLSTASDSGGGGCSLIRNR